MTAARPPIHAQASWSFLLEALAVQARMYIVHGPYIILWPDTSVSYCNTCRQEGLTDDTKEKTSNRQSDAR